MKIRFTYHTDVDVWVDLETREVESIQVLHQIGSDLTGIEGPIHISAVRKPGEVEPFTRDHEKKAIEVIRTGKHPKWTFKEPV